MNELVYIILVSALIGASVVIIGFSELNHFLIIDKKQELIFEIKQLDNKISTIGKYSYGSFDNFELKVPEGNKVIIYKNGTVMIDNLEYKLHNKINCITSNLNKCMDKVEYGPGNYRLILFHGENANANYSISFE